jgi:hypothetical protein
MAEVQTNTESGEMAQRFIEFVMMQAQNAMLFLGQIPHPQSGKPEINLNVAKMFIDQLVMVREKTRGNLSSDESGILNNTISNLQMVFVEASQQLAASGSESASTEPEKKPGQPEAPATGGQAAQEPLQSQPDGGESKKKFSKSYGS